MNCLKNKVLPLIAAVMYLGLSITLYAQGTLSETVTTMELQQQMRSGETRPTTASPAAEATNADQQQTIARFEKVAQKLLKSMQTGRFDREDFSATWSTMLPADANFSDSINALCRPVLAQFGRAEKLLEGKIVGPGRAIFPVQFSGGTLDMTLSLDTQDKIGEWLLTPKTTQTAAPGRPMAGEQETKPVEAQATAPGLPEETNAPDITDFNSFQREINRMNIETRSEEQMWLGQPAQKAELARAIEELVAAQLMFIRKLAESENAEQTVKAIDFVLQQRRERSATLEEKLKDERQQQLIERRNSRTTRSERPDQTTRERTTRRTRETPAEQP
ncbi:MAG: hypothetical protein ABII09_11975 [Planctomycetota bacterium]